MKTKFLKVFCLLLVISMLVVPVNATTAPDMPIEVIADRNVVTLYEGKDAYVYIAIRTKEAMDCFGVQGLWDTKDSKGYVVLEDITTALPMTEEDGWVKSTGVFLYTDTKFESFGEEELSYPKGTDLVTAQYKIPAGTPEGVYTIEYTSQVFTGTTLESIDEDVTFEVEIKVEHHKHADSDGDGNHICDDYENCKHDVALNNHTGGTATCKDPAVCEECNQPYGEKDAKNHVGEQTTSFTNNGETHTVTVTCDCGGVVSETTGVAHNFTNGDCVCGAKKPGMKGDVDLNGVVDMDDVVVLMQHVLKAETITDATALSNGEVTNNTELDMDDVVKLMQYVLKAIDSLD